MDGFKNVEIKNFRGIEHLTIDDFSRVNVFIGQNGSGKSSVLEALLMIAGMSNPELPRNINILRSKGASGKFLDVRYFFHNLALLNPPEISAKQTTGAKRHIALKMPIEFIEHNEIDPNQIAQIQRSDSMVQVNQVEMDFDITENDDVKQYKSTLSFNQQGLLKERTIADGYQEKLYASLIPANIPTGNYTSDLSELIKRKMKHLVVDRLAHFDKRITAIEVLSDGVFVGIEGVPELLPVTMHGDGMFRYLMIVAASANPISDVVLIDEIENGLHYSVYKNLWEAIFALSTTINKQIFVTTHSKETLCSLNEMLEEHTEYQDALRLYTIENTKREGHQAYKYTYEGLAEACKNNVELRSIVL